MAESRSPWAPPADVTPERIADTLQEWLENEGADGFNILPPWLPDGQPRRHDWRWWLLVLPAAVGFAFCWAVAFLINVGWWMAQEKRSVWCRKSPLPWI